MLTKHCAMLNIVYCLLITNHCALQGDQGREVLDKGETEFDHSTEEFLQKGGFHTADLFKILSFLRNIALPSIVSCFDCFLLLQIDNSSMKYSVKVFKRCREMEDHSVHLTYHCMWDHSMHLINQVTGIHYMILSGQLHRISPTSSQINFWTWQDLLT